MHDELWLPIITYALKKTAGIKPSIPYTLNEVHLHISMLKLAFFKVPPRHCDDIGKNVVA
jgi:hypothetical protein